MTAALLKLRTRGKAQGGGGSAPLLRRGQIGFNSPADAGQDTPSFLFLNRMKSCASNGVWNNDATLSAYAYPQSAGTGGRDTATFVGLRRPTTGTIRYVLRHNGAGLVWHFSAQNLTIVDASNPNRVIFDAGPADGDKPQLVLTSATTWPDYKPNNPMETRDGFAIYELSLEADYLAGKQFTPEAVAAQSKYWCHRAMDAFKTNNSLVRTIADKTPVGNCSYSNGTPWGPPLQVIIDLINECNIPVFWYNIPYRASEEYVRWMIQTIKNGLRRSCKAKQETGNEPWNFGAGFDQSFAFYENVGKSFNPVRGNPQGYGYCATLNMLIAREIWADDPDRLICTLNLQADSNSNYEGVAEGVAIAGKHIGKDFDAVSVAMYTSGGAQDLANPDSSGGSAAKRQLLVDETDRYEATGVDFASRTVRQELIDQFRHGNVIPGWPDAITLDGVLRQCTNLKNFCRKYGIRHATIYEMQDPHTNLEMLGPVNGLRTNIMFTAFQNDIRVSGIQEGSYERDRFRYMRSQGVSGYAVLTDVGPLSEYGAWRTKTDFYTPDTRLWDFYEWYNDNAPDEVLFEVNVSGITDLTVGRLANIRVSSFGGLVPTKTRFPTIKSGTLPAGLTYQNGDITGRGTTQGPPATIVFAAYDASGREVTKSVTINMGAQAIGKRFLQFSTDKNLASLAEIRFKRGGVLIDTAGWVVTGDAFGASGEGVASLIDGNLSTPWTGKASGGNTVLFDTGDGNAVMPDTIEMVWRSDLPDRAPPNFTWKWGDTSTALTTTATVTNAAYPGGVCTVTPSYS